MKLMSGYNEKWC